MKLGRFEFCLNVASLKASRDFYEKLGFSVVIGSENLGVVVLENGSCRIGLYQGHIQENLLNFRGGDIPSILHQAGSHGIRPVRDLVTNEDGSMAALFRDPDGNAIYLVHHPEERSD